MIPRTSWRSVLALWVGTLIVFGLYLIYVQPLKDFLAPDIYLDLRFDGYDHAEAFAFFDGLGALGRAFYMRSTVFDTVWPLMLAFAGYLIARQTFRNFGLIWAFAFGPVAFGLLDLIENIGLFAMNFQFPELSQGLVDATNIVTLTKQKVIPVAFGAYVLAPAIAVAQHVLNLRRPG